MIWIFIGFLICMVAGCYVAYKEAKIHELHKMRATFDEKMNAVKTIMETVAPYDDDEEMDLLKGEILGLEKGVDILKEEGADEDLVDEIKKDIEALKRKIKNARK